MPRPVHLRAILASLAILGLILAVPGCKKERKSKTKEESADPVPIEAPSGEPGTISRLEKREGMQPGSSTLAGGDGAGARPGASWVFDGDGPGIFLIAAASSTSRNGDILRRVDLDGTPAEHDFNAMIEGAQGIHLEVPEAMRGDWKKKDFGSDGLFQGTICGLIPGPNKRIIALAKHGAFVLDPHAEGQTVKPDAVIVFPHAFNTCEGVYSKKWNRIYAIEISRTESRTGQQGIYTVEVPVSGMVEAPRYSLPEEYGFNTHSSSLFDSIDMHDDVLYLVESGARFDANYDTGIHRVPLNDQGEPLFADAVLVRAENPIGRAQGCTLNTDNTAAGKIVIVGGKPVLLTGGTQGVAGWDISGPKPERIDLDDTRPGTQALDLEPFGQGMPEIHVAPNGKVAYGLPHCRSRGAKVKLGGDYKDVFTLRMVTFDLTGDAIRTALDDAVDLGYTAFQKELAKGLKPKYMPQFGMSLRDLAVGSNHALVVGAGSSGASGLGAASDVIVLDLAEGGPIAFHKPKDARTAHEQTYGLALGEGDPNVGGTEQTVQAAIWVP